MMNCWFRVTSGSGIIVLLWRFLQEGHGSCITIRLMMQDSPVLCSPDRTTLVIPVWCLVAVQRRRGRVTMEAEFRAELILQAVSSDRCDA